jgi:hypothetical protein
MIFSIQKADCLRFQGTTLEAGTIILTGALQGFGFVKQPRVFLKDGGDIRVQIDKIGTPINKVKYDWNPVSKLYISVEWKDRLASSPQQPRVQALINGRTRHR